MENELDYQKLYMQAQQEIANLQHTLRILVNKLEENKVKEEKKK